MWKTIDLHLAPKQVGSPFPSHGHIDTVPSFLDPRLPPQTPNHRNARYQPAQPSPPLNANPRLRCICMGYYIITESATKLVSPPPLSESYSCRVARTISYRHAPLDGHRHGVPVERLAAFEERSLAKRLDLIEEVTRRGQYQTAVENLAL